MSVEIRMVTGDILEVEADVLAVKYAQGFHSSDGLVAEKLASKGIFKRTLESPVGEARFTQAQRGRRQRAVQTGAGASLDVTVFEHLFEHQPKEMNMSTQSERVVSDVKVLINDTEELVKATTSQDKIDRIVLCGGASRVDSLAELLEERFGAPVEFLDPFKAVTFDAQRLGIDNPADIAPTAAVAVGLALRTVRGR